MGLGHVIMIHRCFPSVSMARKGIGRLLRGAAIGHTPQSRHASFRGFFVSGIFCGGGIFCGSGGWGGIFCGRGWGGSSALVDYSLPFSVFHSVMFLHSCSLVTSLCLCLISARTRPESASSPFGYFRVSGSFIRTGFTPRFLKVSCCCLICIVIISPSLCKP